MQFFLRRVLSGVAILGLAFLFLHTQASAQSNGLGVTPKQSYTMRAGEQATNSLFLSNLNKNQTLTVHIKVVDFEAQDDSGSAKLFQASDQPLTPWSLKPYVSMPDVVTVAPGASKQVPFTIKLPAGVGAGTYYSAVEYTASTGSNTQQVSIAASSATLLFINVPGEVSELLNLQSFGMANSNGTNAKYQSVFHEQPEFFAYRIKNSGNVAEAPAGSLVIKNIFGRKVVTIANANPKAQLVLIGQTRKFTGCNPKDTAPEKLPLDSNCTRINMSPGYYTATLVVYYGQNGQQTRQIGATTHFWYLPWAWVVILVVLLVLLVMLLLWLYRKATHRRRR